MIGLVESGFKNKKHLGVLVKSYLKKNVVFYVLLSFTILSCKKDSSPLGSSSVKLIVEEVGVTEAWLQLEIENPKPGYEVTVRRDTLTLYHSSVTAPETQIYDQLLLPGKEYTYYAILTAEGQTQTFENQLITMDTTSHDFTWEVFTFGSKSSSILSDVFIINENDIWAVGEIYTEDSYTYDSLGNWIEPYNVVHWDGNSWELIRYKHYLSYFQEPHWFKIDGTYAFSDNDIWFANGIVHHYDSSYYNQHGYVESYSLWDMGVLNENDGGIKKLWGTSSSDLYGIGSKGTIVHYDGQTWQRIESGTDLDIHDIWGIYDEQTDEKTILITATDKIIKVTNENQVEDFDWPFSQYILVSIWFKNLYKTFACGDGAFKYSKGIGWEKIFDLPNYFKSHIRGIEKNDVFIAGSFGLVAHYNGLNWKVYPDVYNGLYLTIDYKNNLMVAVGERNSQAVILRMRKN
jgi:hypothetical protein